MIRTWLGIAAALSRTFCVALSSAAWADPPGNGSSPNDPMLAEQWYLFSPSDERGSPGSTNAIEAWRHIRPAKSIVVALLDSGVNYTHPDLAANIWKNERELPNGKDDDGNGYVDDLYGWDFAYADNSPIDRRSRKFPEQFDHGTVLASLMAAVPDNGIGTARIGRNIKVMNLRVVGEPEVEGQTSAQLETTLPIASDELREACGDRGSLRGRGRPVVGRLRAVEGAGHELRSPDRRSRRGDAAVPGAGTDASAGDRAVA
jgi:subtilisin family serine protease